MTDTQPEANVASDLVIASSAAIGALAGAVDDLNRAALCLQQMASGISQRIRGPDDYRRIARQFSERAYACRAAEEALVAACRTAQPISPDRAAAAPAHPSATMRRP